MRTHVWRKSFVRLSQLHKPLPIQRRLFHQSLRHKTAISPSSSSSSPTPPSRDTSEVNAESTTKHSQDHVSDDAKQKKPPTRRSRVYSRSSKELPSFSIPDWFLEHNVRLHDTTTRPTTHESTQLVLFDTRDPSTVIMTLPLHTPSPDSATKQSDSSDSLAEQNSTPPQSLLPDKVRNFWSSAFPPTQPSSSNITSSQDPTHNLQEGSALDRNQEPGPLSPRVQEHETQSNTNQEQSCESLEGLDGTKQLNDKLQDDSPPVQDAKRAADKLDTPSDPASTDDPALLMLLQVHLLLNGAFNITGPASQRLEKPNISLYTADPLAHGDLDRFVESVADLTRADLIRLDANDLAELAAEHIDSPDYLANTLAALPFDVYKGVTAWNTPTTRAPNEPPAQDHQDLEDMDFPEMPDPTPVMPNVTNVDLSQLGKYLQDNAERLGKQVANTLTPHLAIDYSRLRGMENPTSSDKSSTEPTFSITSWDELKLQTLLDTLLDSSASKRQITSQLSTSQPFSRNSFPSQMPDESPSASERITTLLHRYLTTRLSAIPNDSPLGFRSTHSSHPPSSQQSDNTESRTILHIRDFEAIRQTPQGEAIVRLFSKVVQRRRKDGQQIVMIGTTAGGTPSTFMDDLEVEEEEESTFKSLEFVSPPSPTLAAAARSSAMAKFYGPLRPAHSSGYHRLVDINLRNIQNMVRRLGLQAADSLFHPSTQSHLDLLSSSKLGEYAMSKSHVQDIVLFAESLRAAYTQSPRLETIHIAFALDLQQSLQGTLSTLAGIKVESAIPTAQPRAAPKHAGGKRAPSKVNMAELKRSCDKHEAKLLGGVVDPSNIKTTFDLVHAAADTKEALQTLTSLSLLRPEAFQYGVLANDRLPGLLLYGPPGTGKTMLAKAVAKDARSTVLEVSGAQVHEKYVGEGEKMVKAVFSLAKKLSPCIVFIDEADALFGSRNSSSSRSSHREIINQFLREWDGMDDHSVFMMVATNRPFDLDDAVLRRLPRRLLVDLPMAKDRESILGIHLKDETLDASVSLNKIAEQTALYSGSDLKNVCVSAALAAVREENALLTAHQEDEDFTLPERRTLTDKHFEKALAEISASISEDMSSLSSIRKFDEQFGDRKTKRKKAVYGFGGAAERDEQAARVRQENPKP